MALIAVSNGFESENTIATLSRELRSGGINLSSIVLQDNASADQITMARRVAENADIVIAALYGRVRSGSKRGVDLNLTAIEVIRDAALSKKQVIGASFGNPYVLSSLPELKTYLVAYGDMVSLQKASARAMLGLAPITGRLPITLPGLHPRGAGIQIPTTAVVKAH